MTDNLLQEASACFRRERFIEARDLLDQMPSDCAEYVPSRTLLLKCLMGQGKIGECNKFAVRYKEMFLGGTSPEMPTSRDLTEFLLWSSFVRIYAERDWSDIQSTAAAVLEESSDPAMTTLALDLRTRSEVFASIMLGSPPLSQKLVDAGKFQALIDGYREAGLISESLRSKYRQAQFCHGKGNAFNHLAHKLFSETLTAAKEISELILIADSSLYLADLEVIQCLADPGSTPDFASFLTKYERVVPLYEAAGHPFPTEKVCLRLGLVLMEYGLEMGVRFVSESLPAIEKHKHFILFQEGWRQLSMWYLRHGNARELKNANSQLEAVNREIQFGLSTSVDKMGEGDLSFRKGKVTSALEFLHPLASEEGSMLLSAGARLISANVKSSVGQLSEARDEFEAVIALLQREGVTALLSEAWVMYGMSFVDDDLPKSIDCVTEAIKASEGAEEPWDIAKNYTQRGWLRSLYNSRKKSLPVITPEIDADFDQAVKMLNGQRAFEGRDALISLCQMRGQSASLAEDWDACKYWFEQAEQLSTALKLCPHLAFSITYHGLASMGRARLEGPESYKFALEKFQRAEHIFVEAGMDGLVWRPLFYQGLCEYEAGQRTEIGNSQRTERFDRANRLLVKAVHDINDLRDMASSDEIINSYKINTTIGVDKQEIYRTGLQLNLHFRADGAEVFWWLEQSKARALIKARGATLSPASNLRRNGPINRHLVLEESSIRKREQKKIANIVRRREKVPETSPDIAAYTALRKGGPVDWEEFRAYLTTQQEILGNRRLVVFEFYCTPAETQLLTMRADWESPVIERIPIDYQNLLNFINSHFYRPGGVRKMLEDIGEEQWQVYSPLITAVSLYSAPDDVVCLIPNGILHNLPLHTLECEGKCLIERNPVFYSPSASILNYINYDREYDARAAFENVQILGNPTGDLPFAEEEANSIARLFGAEPNLRDKADKNAFLRAAEQPGTLHFAGHGELASTDGFLSRLFLAKGELLTAADILTLSIRSELIVLSGCETGLSVYNTGDELTGLATSLLASGAESLVISQWRVNDESAGELLRSFYSNLAGAKKMHRVDALRAAMLETRKIPRWDSFYHWGGFILYGNWS